MEIINKLITLVIWIIYSSYEGKREAFYYQVVGIFGLKRPNIHWMFVIQRTLFLIVIGLFLNSIVIPVSLFIIFPFFHDGFYYMKYNDLYPNIYKRRFEAESDSSTAIFEFSFLARSLMLIIGTVLFLLNIFICELLKL